MIGIWLHIWSQMMHSCINLQTNDVNKNAQNEKREVTHIQQMINWSVLMMISKSLTCGEMRNRIRLFTNTKLGQFNVHASMCCLYENNYQKQVSIGATCNNITQQY